MVDVQWGPWVKHDGKRVPAPNGVLCHVVYEHSRELVAHITANGRDPALNPWLWESAQVYVIVRYRLARPKALDDLIRLAADPVDPQQLQVKQPEPVFS